MGLIFGGIEQSYITLTSAGAVVFKASGSNKTLTAVAFSIQMKTYPPNLLLSGWNISQNFNQFLWNHIFISHAIHFLTLIFFL